MITITGLGPGDLDRVPRPVLDILLDGATKVVVRTAEHPASQQLAAIRDVIFCDDLYESAGGFDEVYSQIVDRVLSCAEEGPVVYAVPGSPLVGEFAVRRILERAPDAAMIPAESFVDLILRRVDYDPLDRGLQILNGHDLPDPLILDKPTIVAHLDRPEVLADVSASIAEVLEENAEVTVLAGVGSSDERVLEIKPGVVDPTIAGFRTSIYIDAEPGGLVGAIRVMRRLRRECPWDMEQTHHSLIKNLVEETYELVDALEALEEAPSVEDEPDWTGYAAVEDELGDVFLQVLFHEAIARESGGFDINSLAEVLRRKLVRRHPHVFEDVVADSPAAVKENWDRIKAEERAEPDSALDGVPTGMPGLHRAAKVQNRAAKVGFDWETAAQVLPKVQEELDELSKEISTNGDIEAELGDLVFTVVNLARHLGIDVEVALRGATRTFETRFRKMEKGGPLTGLDIEELNRRWEQAKR